VLHRLHDFSIIRCSRDSSYIPCRTIVQSPLTSVAINWLNWSSNASSWLLANNVVTAGSLTYPNDVPTTAVCAHMHLSHFVCWKKMLLWNSFNLLQSHHQVHLIDMLIVHQLFPYQGCRMLARIYVARNGLVNFQRELYLVLQSSKKLCATGGTDKARLCNLIVKLIRCGGCKHMCARYCTNDIAQCTGYCTGLQSRTPLHRHSWWGCSLIWYYRSRSEEMLRLLSLHCQQPK